MNLDIHISGRNVLHLHDRKICGARGYMQVASLCESKVRRANLRGKPADSLTEWTHSQWMSLSKPLLR